ncbi:MAG: hypothetical protein WDO56_25465 [Gammaproteobacteria bacterium]
MHNGIDLWQVTRSSNIRGGPAGAVAAPALGRKQQEHAETDRGTSASRTAWQTVGGWSITSYINHGKSAAVFVGQKGPQTAAIKTFDPEIVARYGKETQLKRVERERSLVGRTHPNLVQIFDGGEDSGYIFVAMEYFNGLDHGWQSTS